MSRRLLMRRYYVYQVYIDRNMPLLTELYWYFAYFLNRNLIYLCAVDGDRSHLKLHTL